MFTIAVALPSSVGDVYTFTPSFPNGAIVQIVKMVAPREDMFDAIWLIEASQDTATPDPAFSSLAEVGAPEEGKHRNNFLQISSLRKAADYLS